MFQLHDYQLMGKPRREVAVRAFTECARMYEQCMGWIGHPVLSAMWGLDRPARAMWRPDLKPRAEGFVADFSLACFAAAGQLSGKAYEVLHLRFVRLLPEERVKMMTGVNGNWRDVQEEIYVECGRVMLERGLWPARKYFR